METPANPTRLAIDSALDGTYMLYCRQAMGDVAMSVLAESTSTTNHTARAAYAQRIVEGIDINLGEVIATAVIAASDGTTVAPSTAAALTTRLTAIWDQLSNVAP